MFEYLAILYIAQCFCSTAAWPHHRNATEPGASRLNRDPLTSSGTAPAKVAYAMVEINSSKPNEDVILND
jgi:hypothetical protein